MSADNVVTIKTDQQKAEEIRASLRAPLEQIAAVMTQAQRDGLKIGFSMAMDGFGRFRVPEIEVTKAL